MRMPSVSGLDLTVNGKPKCRWHFNVSSPLMLGDNLGVCGCLDVKNIGDMRISRSTAGPLISNSRRLKETQLDAEETPGDRLSSGLLQGFWAGLFSGPVLLVVSLDTDIPFLILEEGHRCWMS